MHHEHNASPPSIGTAVETPLDAIALCNTEGFFARISIDDIRSSGTHTHIKLLDEFEPLEMQHEQRRRSFDVQRLVCFLCASTVCANMQAYTHAYTRHTCNMLHASQ